MAQPKLGGLLLRFACVLTALAVVSNPATAMRRDDDFDERIRAELRAKDPEAERLLRAADHARDTGDHRTAADLYAKVVERVPEFVHARRRGAGAELALGDRAKALSMLNTAVEMERSADNLTALARAIVAITPTHSPSDDDKFVARQLTAEAIRLEPKNIYPHIVRAEVAWLSADLFDLDNAVRALERLEPNDVSTHYFGAIASAMNGEFNAALASLDRARDAGLPEEVYRQARASIEKQRPLWHSWARWGAIVAGSIVAIGLGLLVAGVALSTVTLRRSERVPEDPRAGATGIDAALRRAYRIVLWTCCAYYYLSMPLLLGIVLVIGGGLVFSFLVVGHIPVKLLLIVFAITVVTAWSILKSLFVRARNIDPGERLDLEREPALREVLVNVAARVGTRPVDTVFITPGTELAVFERGGFARQLAGKSERCLILGAGVLDGMTMGPFRAVLAHEYGHFSNRDTAGGGFALTVRRSVVALATNLAHSGTARWYNPAWLFVNGFHRVFLRISQGASRLQEVLADRWSALLYGAQAFEDGLRHVIDRSIRFDAHANATLKEVIESKRSLANLYHYKPATVGDENSLDAAIRESIDREPSPYDSHPSPRDRFRWVHALPASGDSATPDTTPVWSVFSNREAIEERMTSVIRAMVAANHGVAIAAQ